MQASAVGWRALAGGNDDASVGWRMECKRRLTDGDHRQLADMMGALAGRWSASVGWWRALAGGEHQLAAMRCERRIADVVQASAGGWRASAGGWQALAAMMIIILTEMFSCNSKKNVFYI